MHRSKDFDSCVPSDSKLNKAMEFPLIGSKYTIVFLPNNILAEIGSKTITGFFFFICLLILHLGQCVGLMLSF